MSVSTSKCLGVTGVLAKDTVMLTADSLVRVQLAQDERTRLHTFTLLPVSADFTALNLKVDITTLHGIAARSRSSLAVRVPGHVPFTAAADEQWPRFFDLNKISKLKPHWKFGGEVVTDGKGASVLFVKERTEAEQAAFIDAEKARKAGGKRKKKPSYPRIDNLEDYKVHPCSRVPWHLEGSSLALSQQASVWCSS